MILIKGSAGLGAAMLIGLSALSAQAGYVVDLTQQGPNVVASGSGAIDLSGLTFATAISLDPLLIPGGIIVTGAAARGDVFQIPTGLPVFGSGGFISADSATGDLVGIDSFLVGEGAPFPGLVVPDGYHSDGPLSDTATYLNQTFKSLGVTPGTFETKWGTGANQNFTLVIGAAAVPEPSTWAMMLLGFAGLGFMGYQSAGRRRTVVNA
jgi:PEP-CTERM motif